MRLKDSAAAKNMQKKWGRRDLGSFRRIMAWHRANTTSKQLGAIPGVGPALATALAASIADPKAFR
jgi:transposase